MYYQCKKHVHQRSYLPEPRLELPSKHAGIGPVTAGIGPVPVGIGPVPASYHMFTGFVSVDALEVVIPAHQVVAVVGSPRLFEHQY